MPCGAGDRRLAFVNEHLSALDATFLELEEADDSAHMHIGSVALFEPWADGGAPPLALVRSEIGSRVGNLPRYRQRLSTPRTGGLRWPEWVEDERFDIAHHVRAAALPAPAGSDDLLAWAGDYFSQRLDRARPLWELVILELGDGGWAMVSKTHHCLVDGVGSVDVVTTLLDSAPDEVHETGDGPAPSVPASAPAPSGSTLPLPIRVVGRAAGAALQASGAALHAAGTTVRLVAAGIETPIRHPQRTADAVAKGRALLELIARNEVDAAPHTSLNEPIGAHRRLEVRPVPLARLREIKNALGGTVNDVILTASAAGFHDLLRARGEELPTAGLRAMVPVNVRVAADQLALGNRVSSLFVHLPVDEADPLERYRRQTADAEELKAGSQAAGSQMLIELAGHAPPVLHTFLARGLFATRLFNVTVTNVPGPQHPLYAFGSRMTAVWPIVPLAASHAVGLAAFSYDGVVFLCLNADRDSMPDLEVVADGIAAAVDELHDLAAKQAPPSPALAGEGG
jgi:diacylglycerol O-acyltransferase / wax synthase